MADWVWARISACTVTSNAVVGSSAMIIFGLQAMAMAIDRDQIAAYLATDVNGTTGIAIDSNLKVSRVGGDGGPVVPTVD